MRRIKILLGVSTLAWVGLVIRLFYWQVGSFQKLFLEARNQHLEKEEISSPRGTIFSSDNFPLVLSKRVYSLFIQPNQIDNPQEVYKKINQILPQDQKSFFEVVSNKKINWYPLAKGISPTVKESLENQKIPGIGFEPQWSRFYPEASMAANLLGFVGGDENGNEKGYFGLEGFYDRELKGISGWRFWERDLFGRPIIIGQEWGRQSKAGRDLYLYLDRSVQFLVENELKEGIKKYGAISGSVVVMDPLFGGILAMASFPSFDPANFAKEDKSNFPNPVVSFNFEPGSVFKPIVMAMAIDLGLVNPSTVCDSCSGPVMVGEHLIKTWNEKYYPNSTMTEIIQHSDNVGMVFVGRKVGIKNFVNYWEKFGFGKKTGIDLEGESASFIREKNSWKEIDLATASFGQGIAVTPIQLTRAIAAFANGGKLITPKVVKKIKDGEKEIWLNNGEEKQIIRPITAKVITQMMVNAVEKGEAKWAKPKGHKIAGKTGTAQIPVAGHYDEEKTIASFVGFAPANDPKFVMLVTLREPKTSPWGSETAAPLWFEIAKGIFQIWGIPPS